MLYCDYVTTAARIFELSNEQCQSNVSSVPMLHKYVSLIQLTFSSRFINFIRLMPHHRRSKRELNAIPSDIRT